MKYFQFMDKNELIKRFKKFSIATIRMCKKLPMDRINNVFIGQILRSSSSTSANYRAACRARSKPDFINKLCVVEEELDETMFFFEMIAEFNTEFKDELRLLYKESNELLSIIVRSINTCRSNLLKAKTIKTNPAQ